MIEQRDNRLWLAINSLARQAVMRVLSGPMRMVVVNEYPKSGGSWLSQMLAKVLGIPFPRNRLPMLCSSVLQGHYLYSAGMRNVVVVWRDARDIAVSQYYHSLIFNHGHNGPLVKATRARFHCEDYEDIHTNLPRFIEFINSGRGHPSFTWSDFVHRWHGRSGVVETRYESLRHDPVSELARVAAEISGRDYPAEIVEKAVDTFSFKRLSGREPGEENVKSFLRKGVCGDWKNHFSQEACAVFDRLAGRELVRLGYATENWVAEYSPGEPSA